MAKRKKKGSRLKGWLLQFATAFGLTASVLAGFYAGYLIGRFYGGETYTGIIGALLGFVVGIVGLILITIGENKEGK
jgi:F0F1-type ATP synthase assembly protein I